MINIKDLFNVLKEAGKIDEYQKIMDLIDDSLELRKKIEELEKENSGFRKKEELVDSISVENGVYWKGKDGPFCTRCFDKEKYLLRLTVRPGENWGICPECKNQFNVTGSYPRMPQIDHRRNSST